MTVVSGSFKISETGFPDVVFKYQEQQLAKGGAGPRGIQIGVTGSKKGVQKYKLDPNPHDNPKYNNGGHAKFYKDAAMYLADLWLAARRKEGVPEAEGKFPRYGKAKTKLLGLTYKFVKI